MKASPLLSILLFSVTLLVGAYLLLFSSAGQSLRTQLFATDTNTSNNESPPVDPQQAEFDASLYTELEQREYELCLERQYLCQENCHIQHEENRPAEQECLADCNAC